MTTESYLCSAVLKLFNCSNQIVLSTILKTFLLFEGIITANTVDKNAVSVMLGGYLTCWAGDQAMLAVLSISFTFMLAQLEQDTLKKTKQ